MAQKTSGRAIGTLVHCLLQFMEGYNRDEALASHMDNTLVAPLIEPPLATSG